MKYSYRFLFVLVVVATMLALPGIVMAEASLTISNVSVNYCNKDGIKFSLLTSGNVDFGQELHLREYVNGEFVRDWFQQSGPSTISYSSYSFGFYPTGYDIPPPYDFYSDWDIDDAEGNTIVRWRFSGTCHADSTGTINSVGEINLDAPDAPDNPGSSNPPGGSPPAGPPDDPGGSVPDNPGNGNPNANGSPNSKACGDNPGRANDHRPANIPPCR